MKKRDKVYELYMTVRSLINMEIENRYELRTIQSTVTSALENSDMILKKAQDEYKKLGEELRKLDERQKVK